MLPVSEIGEAEAQTFLPPTSLSPRKRHRDLFPREVELFPRRHTLWNWVVF